MTQSHIILVRHGEPSASWSEHPDPGLSKEGLNQAEKTSKNFSVDFKSYQLFSSPKKRAVETMECIAKEINQSFKIDDRFIEIPSKGISQNIKHDWLIEIFKTPIKDLPPQISSWYNNLIEWLYNFEDQAIITTHFMVINALVSHLKNNNMIAYFNPGFASRTEIWMQNGILTKLILGKAKKTVLNF